MKLRLVLWAAVLLTISLVHFRLLWKDLVPEVLRDTSLNPYNMLMLLLGLAWLWDRRRDFLAQMQHGPARLGPVAIGVALVVLAWFMPHWGKTGTLRMALIGEAMTGLGLFLILFPRAARFPALAVAPAVLSLLTTLAMTTIFTRPFTVAAGSALVFILNLLGMSVSHTGIFVSVPGPSGGIVTAGVSMSCSGHYSVAMAVSLFVFMLLDARLPIKKTALIALVVLVGMWLVNLLRLVILFMVGHFAGDTHMWTVHEYLGAVLFVAAFAAFSVVYFRMVKASQRPSPAPPTGTRD